MLLKYFYDEALAHASYLVGCQRANQAIVVDPGRDIEQYIAAAAAKGLRLVGVAETHIHADYVSGARELAERIGAKLHLSDEGPAEWKYQFASDYDSQLLKDGDSFHVGNVRFDVMHTPGHTPESISFVLTDEGGGADRPMGIFTGDFVFVGSIGRPDLLEEAAGLKGTAEAGAHDLYRSVRKFLQLPDYLQVWPAHGAGSACGKGLGAVPSSTVGYEKMFNPALQIEDEQKFVDYILTDQPEAPKYFAVMKRVNKEGPRVLGEVGLPESLPIDQLAESLAAGTVIDLSPPAEFAAGHVPGTLNIPAPMLAGWAGWLVDYSRPIWLIARPDQLPEATRVLHKIGIDDLRGCFEAASVRGAGLATESYVFAEPAEFAALVDSGTATLIDVRSDAEWKAGHIAGAVHHFLGRLPDTMPQIPKDRPVAVYCKAGGRAGIACSLLQAAGYQVTNLAGGFGAWQKNGMPVGAATAGAGCEPASSC